jgi:hypothetical protein
MAKGADVGGSLGQSLGRILTDTYMKARQGLLPHEQVEKWRHTTQWLEDVETEMTPLMNTVFAHIKDRDDLDPSTAALVKEMTNPEHQFGTILNLLGLLGAVFTTIPQLGQIAAQQVVQAMYQENAYVPLSPAQAAEAVMRGIVDNGAGEAMAQRQGVNAEVFADLVALTGEPPGPMDMLGLMRRGLISQADVESALLFSRVKDIYIPWVIEMANQPMSAADAIETAIKGVVPVDQAQDNFVIAGGLADQWDILYQAAGDAIGNEQVLSLLNQGLATEADVQQVFGRSRMNPIFYDLALELRHKFLQPYQISEILKAGGATPEQATTWMINLGYGAEQAAALVASGTAATGSTAKQETEAMVIAEYTDQIIDADAAQTMLINLGYTAEVAGAFLDLADAKRALGQRTGAVTAVKSGYLAGRITRVEASGDLDTLQIPAAARDAWLTDWDIEASTKVKQFTTAQVGAFFKQGFMDQPTATGYWSAEGYSAADIVYLVAYYGGPPPPGSPAAITAAATPAASAASS